MFLIIYCWFGFVEQFDATIKFPQHKLSYSVLPAVMMTTAQKSPISASESLNWFMRCANPNTESIKNLALPAGMWLMLSLRMKSPFKHTIPC